MKQIEKDELYENLSQFLKTKGVELKEGGYTKGIHAGCSLLADAINMSQAGLERAKSGLEKGLDQVRQVIHEKTAPKTGEAASKTPPVMATGAAKSAAPAGAAVNGKAKAKAKTKAKAAKRPQRKK